MSDSEDSWRRIRQSADQFISSANQQCDVESKEFVGLGFLYGAARFSAFVVASDSDDLEHYEGNHDQAVEYFMDQFRHMLEENLEQYKTQFAETPRYAHLMKKKGDE